MAQVGSVFHNQRTQTAALESIMRAAGSKPNSDAACIGALTSREASVLALMIQGSTNREAAKILGISPRTVEFHRANVMQKTAAKNLADLMRLIFSGTIHTS